nr:MAG TPA: hypothetical protein [Caudoviricetes sp.]
MSRLYIRRLFLFVHISEKSIFSRFLAVFILW